MSATQPANQGQPVSLNLLDRLFNAMFSLTFYGGAVRLVAAFVFFFLTWSLFAYLSHPAQAWRLSGADSGSSSVVDLLLKTYFASDVIGHLLAILLPFFLCLNFAAIFLDDIFELNDIKTSRNFIAQAAFVLPLFRTLHIEKGSVRKGDERFPIFKIGGPGRVSVSLENVAVFEKVNGTPNIIGPTRDDAFFSRNLDGFERLRNVIDISDQNMDISELSARTKDGLPIIVRNIRLLFSVKRNPTVERLSNESLASRSYSFTDAAILALTYDQFQGDWKSAVRSLVTGELLQFISKHTLGEIFANEGEPEMVRQRQAQNVTQRLRMAHYARIYRYRNLNNARRQINRGQPTQKKPISHFPLRMYANAKRSEKRNWELYPLKRIHFPGRWNKTRTLSGMLKKHYPRRSSCWQHPVALLFRNRRFDKTPRYPLQYQPLLRTHLPFIPRPELSRSFYQQFAYEFSNKANARGVHLEWIDVGTWHTPDGIIFGQHTDAWVLTTENQVRSSQMQLDILQTQARINEMLRLIRQPIYCYWDLTRKNTPREEAIRQIVEEFLGVLRTARDDLREREQSLPETLQPAINHIQRFQRDDTQNRRGGRFI